MAYPNRMKLMVELYSQNLMSSELGHYMEIVFHFEKLMKNLRESSQNVGSKMYDGAIRDRASCLMCSQKKMCYFIKPIQKYWTETKFIIPFCHNTTLSR